MQTFVGTHTQAHIQIHTFKLKNTYSHTVLQSKQKNWLHSERKYLSFWNVLESTWAAGLLLLCSRCWTLTSPQRLEGVMFIIIGRIAYTNTLTSPHRHSLPHRHSYIYLCVFIRSVAVSSSGAREAAGWQWRGWRAVLPWWWLWKRNQRGAEAESQEPQLESCWSDSTCSPMSSLHHCLLSFWWILCRSTSLR